MFLEFGSSPKVEFQNGTVVEDPTNEFSTFGPAPLATSSQRYVQLLLVIVAVICVPWMLCIKPFYLCSKHRASMKKSGYHRVHSVNTNGDAADREERQEILHHDDTDQPTEKEAKEGSEEGGFEFGEVFIHQAIHTIEYCLGTISNTASYLRLWALSLAHAELSEVLWQMVLQKYGITFAVGSVPVGVIILFFLWAFWAVLTIGILLVMEGLSAFLHALRLHWVEFQNKFYSGNGYKFTPFSFLAILRGDYEL